VQRAVNDCELALTLDERCHGAYSLLAECAAGLGELAKAAEDSMAAFLLTGAVDMALASTAELACRELSRESAKEELEFRRRTASLGNVVSEGGLGRGLSAEVCGEPTVLPKEWFARSYLAGYPALVSAFSLDYNSCRSIASEVAELGIEAALNDSSTCSNAAVLPPHLRDLDSAELRPADAEAFLLVQTLAYLLDEVFYKGEVAIPDVEALLNQRRVEEEGVCVRVEALSTEDQLSDLLHTHERHRTADGCCVVADYIADVAAPEAAVLSESKELASVFALLRSETAVRVSGVRWRGSGHVASIRVDDPYYDVDDQEAAVVAWSEVDVKATSECGYQPTVSPQLLARVVSVCGSLAYLCGDSSGALRCLRYSCYLDPRLVDSQVKLGSLLVDLDEADEAGAVLARAREADPLNPFAHMHLAELHMSANDFTEALDDLGKAQQFAHSSAGSDGSSVEPVSVGYRLSELLNNISALLAVAQFRADPASPEVS
jgi:tetratricopeptide (TPR) repeat protein